MAKTVFANGREVAHQGNGGLSQASPNVCKMNPPVPPVPFNSIAKTGDVAKGPSTVTVEGSMPLVEGGVIAQTTGDEASVGGVLSGCKKGPAELMTSSFNVKFEGRNVGRLGDSLFHNKKNAMG